MATQETVAQGEEQGVQGEEEGVQGEEQGAAPAELTSVWNGLRLHVRKWLPREPRGMLYVSHGLREHMGRYELLGEHLAENGILVFGHDHVGHGESEGDRVHVETFDTYVEDVIRHVEDMKREHPSLPCLLMGHSMGGLIALHVARLRPDLFTGMISSGSAAEAAGSAFLRLFVKVLAFVSPQLGVMDIDSDLISSIPDEARMYGEDPLVYHGKLKAKWAAACVDAISVIREEMGTIGLPILIIHGSEDSLMPITASQFIYDRVSSSDKIFERFEGSRHEVLHDVEQERAREFIKDWILNHLSPPEPQSPSQEEPQSPAQEEPQPPVQEELRPPAQVEPQPPAQEEPQFTAQEEPQPPAQEEP